MTNFVLQNKNNINSIENQKIKYSNMNNMAGSYYKQFYSHYHFIRFNYN